MVLLEGHYKRRYRSPIGWSEVGEAKFIGLNLIQDALEKVKVIKERLLEINIGRKLMLATISENWSFSSRIKFS